MRLVRLAHGASGGTARPEPSAGIVRALILLSHTTAGGLRHRTVPTGGFDSPTTHANHQQIGEHHGKQQPGTSRQKPDVLHRPPPSEGARVSVKRVPYTQRESWTIPIAAEMYGIPERALRVAIARKELSVWYPPTRTGGVSTRQMILRRDMDEWVESLKR